MCQKKRRRERKNVRARKTPSPTAIKKSARSKKGLLSIFMFPLHRTGTQSDYMKRKFILKYTQSVSKYFFAWSVSRLSK